MPLASAALPTGVTLTPFGRHIAPDCRDLMNRVYADGFGNVVPFESWWPWLTSDAEYDPAQMLVALSDRVVVGFCHAWTSAFIKDLVVDPVFRRRGLGAALLTQALATYASRGEISADLKTDVDNEVAQAFYVTLGYRIVERVG